MPNCRTILLLLPLLSPTAGAQGVPPRYVVTEVAPDRAGSSFSIAGLSDAGHVAGTLVGDERMLGFRWSPGGSGRAASVSLLDPPPGVAWGDYQAVAVNDDGVVVGLFGTEIGGLSLRRGFRWKDGGAVELLTTEGQPGIPSAINDANWIAGFEGTRIGGPLRAMLWDPDLRPIVIEELSRATAINAHDQVVGFREEGAFPYVARAYLWEDGVMTPLGTLDPRDRGDVIPLAIDDLGRVVGTCEVGATERAFLWTRSSGMTELARLDGQVGYARAYDINTAGWIVGYTQGATGIVNVLWGPDGSLHELAPRMTGLQPEGRWSSLFWALAINDSGQIAGGALEAAAVRPVLLTPAHLALGDPQPIGAQQYAFSVSGARPGKPVFLLGALDDGRDRGFSRLPGCGSIGVALARPRLVSAALAGADGTSGHGFSVPLGLPRMRVGLQALQLAGCTVSQVVRLDL